MRYLSAARSRQALHDQVVRMVDHFAQFAFRNTAFNFHRILMLLVHVITGADLLVTIAQIKGKIGIAF